MYWIRNGNLLLICGWAFSFGMAWVGGWLLSSHLFQTRSRERMLSGMAIGLALLIVLTNLAAWVMPLPAAWWSAAGVILLLGVGTTWRSRSRLWFSREELSAWPQLLVFVGLLVIFALINRGLAIFDDYHNLPLVSRLAAGDFPPRFYLNPDQRLAYHYGLPLFAASLVRIGGFFTWSAFDLSKALSLALTVSLAWLWFRRRTGKGIAAVFGALLILFGGGARWLLALLPPDWLIHLGSGLHLLGSAAETGPNLWAVLGSYWNIEGGGPISFPFAFVNGVFTTLNFAMSGPGAMPQLTLVLLLLLYKPQNVLRRPLAGLIYGLLLASLALTAEHLFLLVWIGLVLALLWAIVVARCARQPLKILLLWVGRSAWVLLPSLGLALGAGGVITEIVRGWFVPGVSVNQSFGFAGFSLRLPPALLSAHLGSLSLIQPAQILIALVEIGPIILLAPWVVKRIWRQGQRGQIACTSIGLASILGFLIPIFIRYGVERDISRLMGSALWIWLLLGFPLLWIVWKRRGQWARAGIAVGYTLTILGGLTLFMVQWVAIARPQFTYFVKEPDVQMSKLYWNRLPPDTQVLDVQPIRTITVFGRTSGSSYVDLYNPLPEWKALIMDLDPTQAARAGYDYLYLDRVTWQQLSPDQKNALQQTCVQKLAETTSDNKDFRWLLRIKDCR